MRRNYSVASQILYCCVQFTLYTCTQSNRSVCWTCASFFVFLFFFHFFLNRKSLSQYMFCWRSGGGGDCYDDRYCTVWQLLIPFRFDYMQLKRIKTRAQCSMCDTQHMHAPDETSEREKQKQRRRPNRKEKMKCSAIREISDKSRTPCDRKKKTARRALTHSDGLTRSNN